MEPEADLSNDSIDPGPYPPEVDSVPQKESTEEIPTGDHGGYISFMAFAVALVGSFMVMTAFNPQIPYPVMQDKNEAYWNPLGRPEAFFRILAFFFVAVALIWIMVGLRRSVKEYSPPNGWKWRVTFHWLIIISILGIMMTPLLEAETELFGVRWHLHGKTAYTEDRAETYGQTGSIGFGDGFSGFTVDEVDDTARSSPAFVHSVYWILLLLVQFSLVFPGTMGPNADEKIWRILVITTVIALATLASLTLLHGSEYMVEVEYWTDTYSPGEENLTERVGGTIKALPGLWVGIVTLTIILVGLIVARPRPHEIPSEEESQDGEKIRVFSSK